MIQGKSIYGIIPARGGSKSLPRKNILPLRGKPLLSYTIAHSLTSNIIDRTIVSTDDDEIAQIARKYGAEVPFIRPKKYAEDTVQDFPVFHHALIWLEEHEKKLPDIVVLLRPTSPLRPAGIVEKGVSLLLKNKEADSVRSVALCTEHPYRIWKLGKTYMYSLIPNVTEPYNIPRQQLPPFYYQTGDIEVMWSDTILKKKSISGKNIVPLILDKKDLIDIDTKEDFKRAEKRVG